MGIINIENVKPGMVLADKVLTSKRMVLLPEGTVLTEGHLTTFKTWGITEINIEGEGDSDTETLSPEELAALEEEIKDIFRFNDLKKPVAAKLFETACSLAGKS